MSDQQYNIQFVSNITGINPHTIRAWEKRYNAISPARDNNGRRVYYEDDIERLNKLNSLVKNGNSISDIAHLSDEKLDEIRKRFLKDIIPTHTLVRDFDFEGCLANMKMGLDFFKLDIISHELAKATSGLDSRQLALKIIAPFLWEIRLAKTQGKLTPDNRHTILTIIRAHIFGKLFKDESINKERPKVVLASPGGYLNELGTMLAALLCQGHNLNFYYLGNYVEPKAVAEISKQFKADIIFIGLNYSTHSFNVDQGIQFQKELISHPYEGKVLIGTYDQTSSFPDFQCIDDFSKLDHYLHMTASNLS